MRIWPFIAILASILTFEVAHAADPVRLDLAAIDEQPGRMAITLNAAGPDGKPLTGLTTDSFRVYLDDVAVGFKDFQITAGSAIQTSVLLLVDVSGSMVGEPINQARQAMQGFVSGLDPNDQLAVMAFDSKVNLLQDFTIDRALVSQALGRLTPQGDTALYDAVIQGTQKLSAAPPGRHVVVLLTDGVATTNLDLRAASITAATASGTRVVAIGLGPDIDKTYLTELANASGGNILTAPTPASLRQLYTDLASTIRNQYTLVLNLPPGMDRTRPVKLTVRLSVRAGTTTVERQLGPLQGAVQPPFALNLKGLAARKSIRGPATVQPAAPPGITLANVDYLIDGKPAYSTQTAPFTFELDPAGLEAGAHLLRVVATDPTGKKGETQVGFSYAAPGQSSSFKFPTTLVIILGACALAGGLIYLIVHRRKTHHSDYQVRVKSWTGRTAEPAGPGTGVEGWPEPAPAVVATATAPPPPPEDRLLGRLIVMEEQAIREGRLDAITEYELRSTPLTFGSGRDCDIHVDDDDDGRIAAEEARIWVQKGRLIYHKLTTLSAMATEGVTSGWLFLDNGEEVGVGAYRLVFQAEAPIVVETVPEIRSGRTQEHGMTIRDLWSHDAQEQAPVEPPVEYFR